MKNNKLFLFCLCLITLSSCEVKVDPGSTEATAPAKKTDSKIRNEITVQAKGLKIEQAFLLYQDGTLVPEGNKAKVGEDVNMRLIISGWKEENGMVYPGAGEKITTSNNNVVLDEKDLFADYTATGVKASDAKYITLTATITKVEVLVDYYEVSFRVWDKKGDGEITGSYKLHI